MRFFLYSFTLFTYSTIWAQEATNTKNSFFLCYPIELLAAQPRIGYEYEFNEYKSLVIDAQYFVNKDPVYEFGNYNAFAIKSDLRFYKLSKNKKNRSFRAVNLLLKRVNNANSSDKKYDINVVALNYKFGKEFFLKNNMKLDLFTGLGVRYKSKNSDFIFGGAIHENVFFINILLGLALKFR
ncbi:MAG: DUF3575 domain-containing protein [Bacteroidia bacterium]|nr:DUF3575 domain-containing protein [Bacteroidia bacterium]